MNNDNAGVLEQIFDIKNRPDPYPLFAQLRSTPLSVQHVEVLEKSEVHFVSTYADVARLIEDPRISSDTTGVMQRPGGAPDTTFFNELDGPPHHQRRAKLMHNFGPPARPGFIDGLAKDIEAIVHAALDKLQGKTEIDFVEDFAYPVPVQVICKILGVPAKDEHKFHQWSQDALSSVPQKGHQSEKQQAAQKELAEYIGGLVALRKKEPQDDFLSALVKSQDKSGMSDEFIVLSGVGLLVAGHETTVNLLANGMLTFLRHPEALDAIRADPDLIIPAVEEILRMEPPSQFILGRIALDDIDVGGGTIPKGAIVGLSIAGANRDPAIFPDPDTFRLDRIGTAHFTFGSGAHYCFGAPLARLEGQIALKAIVGRIQGARLLEDPPPYRESPTLRGPSSLRIAVDSIL